MDKGGAGEAGEAERPVVVALRGRLLSDAVASRLTRTSGIPATAVPHTDGVAGVSAGRPGTYVLPALSAPTGTGHPRSSAPPPRVILVETGPGRTQTGWSPEPNVVGLVPHHADPDSLLRLLRGQDHPYLARVGGNLPADGETDRAGGGDLSSDIPPPPASLTDREREVLRLVASGSGHAAAADQLGISTHTVRAHMNNIRAKLRVHSLAEVMVIARRAGLIPSPGPLRN